MSLSPENELIIRRAVSDRMSAIPGIGYVIPAPIYFADRADFLNQISGLSLTTRVSIEKSFVHFAAVYPLQFTESESLNVIYEIYLFAESSLERNDETSSPDDFLKRLLKRHSAFVKAWLGIRNEFEESQTLSGLPGYSVKRTAPVEQSDFIQNNEICKFVPDLRGYAVRLALAVNLLENNSC